MLSWNPSGGGTAIRRALLAMILLGIVLAVQAAEWTKEEQEAWLAAQEDYNFGDLESAIRGLKALAKAHPDDPRIWRLLAMSYAELGDAKQAEKAFARWRKLVGAAATEDRDAVLMQARVAMQSEQHERAVAILRAWLQKHPEDADARMQLGAALVAANMLDAAESFWRQALQQAKEDPTAKAAASYYLAWIAAARGNADDAMAQAQAAIQADPEGPYAASAKALIEGLQAQQGFSAQIALGLEHTSNVELLPDIRAPQQGKSKADNYLSAQLGLAWQKGRFRLGYDLSLQKYFKRSDFDLLIQALLFEIALPRGWSWTPRIEHAMLARAFLFSGVGFDLAWRRQGWQAGYALRARRYSSAFGAQRVNLSRLGGLGHELFAGRTVSSADQRWSVLAHWHWEQTKGDAAHPKTDDYQQIGLAAFWQKRLGRSGVQLQLTGWQRAYRKPDPLGNGLVRRDRFLLLGAEWSWRFGTAERHELAALIRWQRNDSNFKAPSVPAALDKTYTEWGFGMQWRAQW